MKRRNVLAGFVVALGCSQMIGYLTGAKTVSACGAGSCFAPMAEVFSSVETGTPRERFEPFAAEYSVRGADEVGAIFEQRITPELLARIEGPHARRANYLNAFVVLARDGADDAEGADADAEAELTTVEAARCFGLGPAGPLRAALELPAGAHALVMQVAAGGDGRADGDGLADEGGKTWTLALDCTR